MNLIQRTSFPISQMTIPTKPVTLIKPNALAYIKVRSKAI